MTLAAGQAAASSIVASRAAGGGIFLRGRGGTGREHRKAGRGVRWVGSPGFVNAARPSCYRGDREIGDTLDLWSAPARPPQQPCYPSSAVVLLRRTDGGWKERSGDGAFANSEPRAERAKAGSRFA